MKFSDVAYLDYLREEINKQEPTVQLQKNAFDRIDAEVKRLDWELKVAKASLHPTSEAEVDLYNVKVNQYNAKLNESKRALDVYNQGVTLLNRKINDYNTKLQSVGVPE